MLLLASLFACGTADKDADGEDADLVAAEELLAALGDVSAWANVPGWDGVMASCDGTHGPMVEVWADTAALDAIGGGVATFPEGATLVKAAYDEDGATLRSTTLMQKRAGSAPDAGDWYWARYDASGAATNAGAVTMCSGCHASAGTDYAFTLDAPGAPDAAACDG